jgi:hypothetical protein
MKWPEKIEVWRKGAELEVFIDGEEFPWFILREPIVVPVSADTAPSITVTIPASRVLVDDNVGGSNEEEAHRDTDRTTGT